MFNFHTWLPRILFLMINCKIVSNIWKHNNNHMDIWTHRMVNLLLVGIINVQEILVLKALNINSFILNTLPMLISGLYPIKIIPSHVLFVDIVYYRKFFGKESYIDHNKTCNQLYISGKLDMSLKQIQSWEHTFKTFFLHNISRLVLLLTMKMSQLKLNFRVYPFLRIGMYMVEDLEESIGSKMKLVKLRRNWTIEFGLS